MRREGSNKPWRPGDAYSPLQVIELGESPSCPLWCRVLSRSLAWAPLLLAAAAVLLALQGCAPSVVKRCQVGKFAEQRCECRDSRTGRYVKCP
jgi:hypothetical protein